MFVLARKPLAFVTQNSKRVGSQSDNYAFTILCLLESMHRMERETVTSDYKVIQQSFLFFSFDKRIVLIRLSGPPNFIINDRQSMPQVPKSDFEGFNTVDKISV